MVLDSLFKSKNMFALSTHLANRSLCGRVGKRVHVQIIPLPQIDRIDGSSLGHATSFLRFLNMFLGISLDAIFTCKRLGSQSDC